MVATSTWQRRLLCLLILLVSVGGLGGCARAVSWQALEKFDARTGTFLGPTLSYCGSDTRCHYFRLYGDRTLFDEDDVYVRRSATPVSLHERPYSTNPADWLDITRDISSSGFSFHGGLKSLVVVAEEKSPTATGKAQP